MSHDSTTLLGHQENVDGTTDNSLEPRSPEERSQRLALQKALLPNGVSPSNFSITLGAAPCIHSCLFCPQSFEKPKNKEWLDWDLLRKCLTEMPEEGILLNVSSYSETMLAPNLFPSLRLMKEVRKKLPIVLATNGISITEQQVHQLIDVDLDIFQFSFDAADRETYKILMQVDHFERAAEKLEMVCRIRNERKSSMKINTHVMAFENQKANFEVFKKRWEGKVDNVIFRSVGNWGDDAYGLKKRMEAKGFIPIYQKPAERYPWTSIFMHFKLSNNGHYYPCVAYVPALADEEKHSLGDARNVAYREAWGKLNIMRAKHLRGEWDQCHHCGACDVWGLWQNMYYKRNGVFELDEAVLNVNSRNA